LGWRVADGAVVVEEENPDDAAVENTGIGVTMPLACICHAQLENLGRETVSTFFSVAPPCKYKVNLLSLKHLAKLFAWSESRLKTSWMTLKKSLGKSVEVYGKRIAVLE